MKIEDIVEIRDYLKNHLKLEWRMDINSNRFIALTLEGELITYIPFEVE